MARKKRTKIPVKALGVGAAVLIGLGLLSGGEEETAPEPAQEPVRAAVVTPVPVYATDPPPGWGEASAPTAAPQKIHGRDPLTAVYVSKNGVIHFRKDCSGMKNYTEMTLEQADAAGYEYCSRCG